MIPKVKSVLEGGLDLVDKFIPDYEKLAHMVGVLKEAGYTVVLTQGVWDMFHVGHCRYLKTARSFGDVLIVGVDSDELTREMKGPDRPFDVFEDRAELLAGLSFVNILTRRDIGQHQYDLIKIVRPDVLVMSKTTSSFTEQDKVALKEYCGQIEHLEAQAPPVSTSTTAKIKRLQLRGVQELAGELNKALETVLRKYIAEGQDGKK